jgi:hypothetical protein
MGSVLEVSWRFVQALRSFFLGGGGGSRTLRHMDSVMSSFKFCNLISSLSVGDLDHLRRSCRQRYAFSSVMQMGGDIIIALPSHPASVLPFPPISLNYFHRLMKSIRGRLNVEPIALSWPLSSSVLRHRRLLNFMGWDPYWEADSRFAHDWLGSSFIALYPINIMQINLFGHEIPLAWMPIARGKVSTVVMCSLAYDWWLTRFFPIAQVGDSGDAGPDLLDWTVHDAEPPNQTYAGSSLFMEIHFSFTFVYQNQSS